MNANSNGHLTVTSNGHLTVTSSPDHQNPASAGAPPRPLPPPAPLLNLEALDRELQAAIQLVVEAVVAQVTATLLTAYQHTTEPVTSTPIALKPLPMRANRTPDSLTSRVEVWLNAQTTPVRRADAQVAFPDKHPRNLSWSLKELADRNRAVRVAWGLYGPVGFTEHVPVDNLSSRVEAWLDTHAGPVRSSAVQEAFPETAADTVNSALHQLARQGRVVRVGHGVYAHRDHANKPAPNVISVRQSIEMWVCDQTEPVHLGDIREQFSYLSAGMVSDHLFALVKQNRVARLDRGLYAHPDHAASSTAPLLRGHARFLAAIRDADTPLTFMDIMSRANRGPHYTTNAIRDLLNDGTVTRIGHGAGATYTLTNRA